ncbi:hypothetical protein As57867_016071, partial [Aphanomyces stellatus]
MSTPHEKRLDHVELTEAFTDAVMAMHEVVNNAAHRQDLNNIDMDYAQGKIRAFEASYTAMQAKTIEFQQAQITWAATQAAIQARVDALPPRITLNVRGRFFATSKTTLLRVETSYFYSLLSSGLWCPDGPDNSYFLDLNPQHFDRILEFLHSGVFSLDGLTGYEQQLLQANLDYLQLRP